MGNGILPVSTVVNVSITQVPQGLADKNVNSLALFTDETPDSLNAFEICYSSKEVEEYYGSSSVTKQMADAIFSQSPNILTGKGRLVVIPLLATATSATQGKIVTADISANLATLIAVTSGDLKVTVDSVDYNLTGINLSGATTLTQVAQILQNSLVNCIVSADEDTDKITFTSKKVGAESTVALAAVAGGSGTDLSGATMLNATGATATGGADSSGETILEAISRVEEEVSFVGVITSLQIEDDVIEDIADAIQAQDRMFLHHFSSTADIAGIATTIKDSSNTKTRCIGYFQSPQEANLMKSAYAGRAFAVNFSGSNTVQSMHLKPLATITYDTVITSTIITACDTAGMDVYTNYAGVSGVFSSGGNRYFDQPYNVLALKFALETGGFNYLYQSLTKIPQTEEGMDGLKNAYAQVLERFVRSGYIGLGNTWNSANTFGDPVIFKDNITEKGYYIYSLPISQQAQAEREGREAPLVQIAIKEAGSIHSSDVWVIVEA